jgi:hypothetical protein
MKGKGMKKSITYVALMVLICTALMATVPGAQVDSGKDYPQFSPHVISNQVLTGNTDTVKAWANLSHFSYDTIAKWSSYSRPKYSESKFSLLRYSEPKFTSPLAYPSVTPVPEQPNGVTLVPGASGSSLGGIIIRGTEGNLIDIRSNFYDPSEELYDGRWHYQVGIVPAYWENMLLPGSYTIRVSNCYCETVTVAPGKTVVLDANCGGFMCVFGCSSC